ncbi:MAG: F-box protein [Tatlockia sp.]|jgi:hypothetical protein
MNDQELPVSDTLTAIKLRNLNFRHPEQSEGSPRQAQCQHQEILRFAQDDGLNLMAVSDTLPPEAWENIFVFLDVQSLFAISLTSKLFHAIALRLLPEFKSNPDVLTFVKSAPYILNKITPAQSEMLSESISKRNAPLFTSFFYTNQAKTVDFTFYIPNYEKRIPTFFPGMNRKFYLTEEKAIAGTVNRKSVKSWVQVKIPVSLEKIQSLLDNQHIESDMKLDKTHFNVHSNRENLSCN